MNVPYLRPAAAAPHRLAADDDALVIAVVNNMADGALRATERQFLRLLRPASLGARVRVMFTTLPGIARGLAATAHCNAYYENFETLFDDPPDGLIVTGTVPLRPRLQDERFWPYFCDLADLVHARRIPTLWSCLAAHAALAHIDGIARCEAPEKISGIFECRATRAGSPFMHGMPARWRVPHSRYNGIRAADLAPHGYEILSHAGAAGVDMFARRGAGMQLFLQGHPEYESDTLLREQCRDAGVPLPQAAPASPAAWQKVAETIMRNFLGEVSISAEGARHAAAPRAALPQADVFSEMQYG